MAKRKMSKNYKRRLVIFIPLSLVIIGFFVFNFISYAYNIANLNNQEKNLKEKLINLESEEKDLNTEIIKLKDPEYIAKYAREKYYYSKNGEFVLKFEEKEEIEQLSTEDKNYNNYIIYGGILVLFIIFVFILKRKKK